MRRTKIVATLGPASAGARRIGELVAAGVDVFRLNKSHGERDWHEAVFKTVRDQSRRAGKPVAVMVDLQGPKMRIGRVADGLVTLEKGKLVDLRHGADGVTDAHTIYAPMAEIITDLKKGDRVLFDDGNVIIQVVSKARGVAKCRVVAGGRLSDHKGLNLPGVKLSVPSVTEKDLEDLRWAAEVGAEYVAVSFVRRPEDITAVRSAVHAFADPPRIIAKIEKPEALECLEDIARLADGLMVARGDLGVEMPLEEVPVAQQRIIATAHAGDIPVIVATQMLESMTGKPRPTRAEVSDVAAAIFGGTDAVMLSGETAVGAYPVESVRQMAAIAETVEEHMADTGELEPLFSTSVLYAIADSVCHGAYAAARDLGARAVFVSTTSGRTALLFSKYRFSGVLVGASDDESAVRRMALYWGVRPIRVPRCRSHQVLLERMTKVSMERGYVSEGDTLIFLAGSPLGKTGATNTMIVHRIKPAVRDGKADFVEGRTAGGTLRVDRQACIMCGACLGACPVEVFAFSKDRLVLKRANLKKCLSDWRCRDICPVDAIEVKGAKEGEARK